MKRQDIALKKILKNKICDKELVSKIHKKLSKLKNKGNNLQKKAQKI